MKKNEYHFGSNPATGTENRTKQRRNEKLGLEKSSFNIYGREFGPSSRPVRMKGKTEEDINHITSSFLPD